MHTTCILLCVGIATTFLPEKYYIHSVGFGKTTCATFPCATMVHLYLSNVMRKPKYTQYVNKRILTCKTSVVHHSQILVTYTILIPCMIGVKTLHNIYKCYRPQYVLHRAVWQQVFVHSFRFVIFFGWTCLPVYTERSRTFYGTPGVHFLRSFF